MTTETKDEKHAGAESYEYAPSLLPCPFCGGGATLHTDIEGCWNAVICNVCGIKGTGNRNQDYKAVEQWNTRARSELLDEVVVSLGDFLEIISEFLPLDRPALGDFRGKQDRYSKIVKAQSLLTRIKEPA